ncbi:Glycosyltransferase involved in cell wall bisynthesis [Geodermatophilus obscurus]|uniref:Glycosyltransferase involved in cell wall bisynthesis n=1 Tax=Geodermatophilus obscurus TaxID=1861 RepID=A0A1I5F9I9_9ACTN|nr:glycosyltransferase family 2 protein [Geodermatophilus obscurus]SFO20427.1 Glycosyltransferase involved in cell wall bisynthesis [Geodermatophilus obscurus]
METDAVKLSVVVPCYNEEAVLDGLVEALKDHLPAITDDFEVILVDDGSRDDTLAILRRTAVSDPRFRYLALSRNFGKESAMLAGLSQTRGEAVVIMDADLQHPPQLIAEMLTFLDKGYDQVVARRNRTGDALFRTLVSRAYYLVINRLIDVRLEDGVGDFRVLSRTAVRAVLALGECNRFSKGLFSWIGFNTTTVDYDNVAREAGESKWRLRDLVDYGIDSVVSFNSKPLRLAIHVGALAAFVAFLYAAWVVTDALVQGNAVPGYVTTICAVVGFGGLQMILLGVTGEYLGRIYVESKGRPHFLLKESSEGAATPVTVPLGARYEQFAQLSPTLRTDTEREAADLELTH